MKKTFVLLLSFILIFNLSFTAMAADDGYVSTTYSFNGVELPTYFNQSTVELVGVGDIFAFWETYHAEYPNSDMIITVENSVYKFLFAREGVYRNNAGGISYYKGFVQIFDVSGDKLNYSNGLNVTTGQAMSNSPEYIHWSADDVVDNEGTIWWEGDENFIPPPPTLQEIVLEVAGEELRVTAPEMGGTMKTLALCGVGLMASLVALKLFGKKSLLFLRK